MYKKECMLELYEVFKTCNLDNRDGYGSLPISDAVYNNSVYILNILPSYIDYPEVCPCPDGSISLDWIKNKKEIFTLCIDNTKTVLCMYSKNGNKHSRIFDVDNDKLNLIKFIISNVEYFK